MTIAPGMRRRCVCVVSARLHIGPSWPADKCCREDLTSVQTMNIGRSLCDSSPSNDIENKLRSNSCHPRIVPPVSRFRRNCAAPDTAASFAPELLDSTSSISSVVRDHINTSNNITTRTLDRALNLNPRIRRWLNIDRYLYWILEKWRFARSSRL